MSGEIASNENTIEFDLDAEGQEVEGGDYDAYGNLIGVNPLYVSPELSLTPVPEASVYTAPYVAKSKVQPSLDKKIIAYDSETTGTNPWEYRLLGGSFWDLSKPVATMESFFSFDEEEVTRQMAEYLNREKPDAILEYNDGFDQRSLLTRLMLYQIPVPGWNKIEWIDLMSIMKKGTTQSIYSSQAAGSEENWLKYFFNESKPYNIEECLEGVRNLDLTRMKIRNRTCTEGVGHVYLLFRYVTDEEQLPAADDKPSAAMIDEAVEQNMCLVVCPACNATNGVACDSSNNKCWRCLGNVPNPTPENRVREQLRPYDFTKVGLKG